MYGTGGRRGVETSGEATEQVFSTALRLRPHARWGTTTSQTSELGARRAAKWKGGAERQTGRDGKVCSG